MAQNNARLKGTVKMYEPGNGTNPPMITTPVIGIVKNNVDATRCGRIDVYIAQHGGPDPDSSDNWIRGIRYLSPFLGSTGGTAPKTGDGAFVGNPQSYGFWASAPDIGTEVLCIFVDGRLDQGYYIGCVPQAGLMSMVPAIGASSNVVPNESEGASYGGADRLPTSEVNASNPSVKNSPTIHGQPKPVHSYQAAVLSAQGLIRDNTRGVISSNAQRETPSRVFGISTPGGPIFEGGYTSSTIKDAAKTADTTKLKQVGRTGGHTFVMDDGTIDGKDQLIRLRSSAGHQITMSDSGQTLFIIHSNGQSWIEMGREGTIDIYSTNSFNVRTQGDINFHADRDINLNAAKNLNMFGENINIEASKNYSQRTGVNFSTYTMGTYTVKVDGSMSHDSTGQASYKSSAVTFINGSKINLNSGSASLTPAIVPVIQKTNHIDTTNSASVGWMNPSPEPLVSITNRAPAHQPWIGSGKGVDVKVSSNSPSTATQATPAATAVNNSAPAAPATPVTPAAIASAPQASAGVGSLTAAAKTAVTAQLAASTQNAVATGAQSATNIVTPATGATPQILESAGQLKPGSAGLVSQVTSAGQSMIKSVSAVTTGSMGITNVTTLVTNVGTSSAAVGAAVDKAMSSLTSAGVLTGRESGAQSAGLVMGAVTSGVAAVKSLVSTGMTSVSGLMDSVAGGKFAAGLSDSLSFAGLQTSLSGMADSLGNSISSLTNNLKSGLQNAYASVEKSFGTLKAGVANVLGPKTDDVAASKQPSDVAKASDAYAVAEAEIASAEDVLLVAKRNYRSEPTEENNAALQTAEAALSAANQKKAQASSQLLKSSTGTATASTSSPITLASISSAVSSAKTTLNSGLNALPGGPSILQSVVNKTAIGSTVKQASAVLGAVDSVLTKVGGLSAANGALSGDLVNNTKAMVGDAMSSVTGSAAGALGKIEAGAAGIIGQLEASFASISSGTSTVKSAAAATDTFDNTAIIAKTGQLLGDPKIPAPIFKENYSIVSADTQSAAVSSAINSVKEANAEKEKATLLLAETMDLMDANPGDTSYIEKYNQQTKDLELANIRLAEAEQEYTTAVTA